VPADVDAGSAAVAQRRLPRGKVEAGAGTIEVEIDGVTIRVGRGADAKTLMTVLSALSRRVIGPTGAVRVMVVTRPVDFRKGAEGLAALVGEKMTADPFSGAVYVFRAKRADRIKLIFWDGTGLCLFAKSAGDGIFRWPKIEDGVMRLVSIRRRPHGGHSDRSERLSDVGSSLYILMSSIRLSMPKSVNARTPSSPTP
jgi:transposase